MKPEHFLRVFPLTRSFQRPNEPRAFEDNTNGPQRLEPTRGGTRSSLEGLDIEIRQMEPVMQRFTDVEGFFRIFLFQSED